MTTDELIEKALEELRAPMGRYGTNVFNNENAREILSNFAQAVRESVVADCAEVARTSAEVGHDRYLANRVWHAVSALAASGAKEG